MASFKKSVAMVLIFLPMLAVAQRLPAGVTPEHYTLSFTPDLQKAAFTGQETIEVQVLKATSTIVLNAIELQLQEVTITQAEKTQAAQTSLVQEKEQATLTVAEQLQPGPASIHIKFSGILNDKLRGFYLARTKERGYATTQFESTDARRAFPAFDEPEFKAKFDITLTVDKADTAISNGRIISDTPGPADGKHTIQFSTTPKMSTYLVAMAVGDFECIEGPADNIPIRVCGTPDKKPLSAAALRYAGEILKFYNQYYGIPYPFGKLDIVGLPDFEAGAMENTGAIFYRESLLFIDDKNSSVDSHQAVFEVLAHEMAHQWFGDLVTMKWWDNLWLNEGFATWMALKPSQALHPEWNAALDGVRATNGALQFDSLKNTHPIRAKADTPEAINELFDTISYEKGAAVLRMVEAYVSPDVFRRGVNAYLRKFAWSNAAAEDFWQEITVASGRRVDQIMPAFISQPGVPLVSVKSSCVAPQVAAPARHRRRAKIGKPQPKTEVTLTQTRFFSEPGAAGSKAEDWVIPVCIKASDAKPFCQLLSRQQQVIPMAGCASWVFANSGAAGYYRTRYEGDVLQKVDAAATTQLNTAERIALVADQSALMRAGQLSVGNYLDLITALNQDTENSVVGTYGGSLNLIHDYLLTSADKEAFRAWVRVNFRPMLAKIGWAPSPGEADDVHNLRSSLIGILGGPGEDPETIQKATALAKKYLEQPDSVDPSIAPTVLSVAAAYGDSALFQQYLAAMRHRNAPEQFYSLAGALASFHDPQLAQQWLEIIVSPEIRNQDAAEFIADLIPNLETNRVGWEWVEAHWPQVEAQLTLSSGGALGGATRAFCDAGSRDDVQKFFTEHKVASSERTL